MSKHEVFDGSGNVVESRDLSPEEVDARNFSLRGFSYPPLSDQVGALMKAIEGTDFAKHPELKAMLKKIKAVKAQHPKVEKRRVR